MSYNVLEELAKEYYSIIKRVFHFSHIMVTIVKRVRIKFMFACFAYNVYALKIING